MIKANGISNVDNFGDEIIFDVIVDCDYKGLINKAKRIDGEDYMADCFVVRVLLDENGFNVLNEGGDSELYYTDNDGEYVSLNYMLKKRERKDIIRVCVEDILKELEEVKYNLAY